MLQVIEECLERLFLGVLKGLTFGLKHLELIGIKQKEVKTVFSYQNYNAEYLQRLL